MRRKNLLHLLPVGLCIGAIAASSCFAAAEDLTSIEDGVLQIETDASGDTVEDMTTIILNAASSSPDNTANSDENASAGSDENESGSDSGSSDVTDGGSDSTSSGDTDTSPDSSEQTADSGSDTSDNEVEAPDSIHLTVSSEMTDETLTVTITTDSSICDRLKLTLEDESSLILTSSLDSSGNCVFSFTVDSALENTSADYVPGCSENTDIWFEELKGTLLIPETEIEDEDSVVSSSTETDAESGDSSSSEAESSDSSSSESSSGSSSGSSSKKSSSSSSSSSKKNSSSSGSSSKKSSSSSGSSSKKSKSSSGSSSKKSSSSSGSSSKKSGSSSGSSSDSSDSSLKSGNSVDSQTSVTEANSALGSLLLGSDQTLIYDPDKAPEIDGLTYEATWESTEDMDTTIYLFEEGYAVLEIAASDTSEGSSKKKGRSDDEALNSELSAADISDNTDQNNKSASESSSSGKPSSRSSSSSKRPSGRSSSSESDSTESESDADSGYSRKTTSTEKENLRFLLVPEISSDDVDGSDISAENANVSEAWLKVLDLLS